MKKDLDRAIRIAGKIVDEWLPLKIKYDHTPGAVVCISVHGKPLYIRSFGFSDLDKKVKVGKKAQFRVASMSKMFTAVSVMQLQEQSKLRIDDKVSEYISWFKGIKGKVDLSNVTIRQLLSHNSGIFRDGLTGQWFNDVFPKDLKGTISKKSVIFENGTTFKYSNHGYAILGYLIEKVSGISYEEYVTRNIVKKLGLKNTIPDLPDKKPVGLVSGYQRSIPDLESRKKESHIKTNSYAPATGFISNAEDMSLFLSSFHLDSKKSVISRESKKEMMRVQCFISEKDMYGLGLSMDEFSGQRVYGHSGGFAGFTTNAISEPQNDIQVVVLTNTISGTAWNVSNNVMRLVHKLLGMKDAKFLLKDKYSGTYRCRWGDMVVVGLGNGDIVSFSAETNNPSGSWTSLKRVGPDQFKDQKKQGFESSGELIRFRKILKGKAQEMFSDGMVWTRKV